MPVIQSWSEFFATMCRFTLSLVILRGMTTLMGVPRESPMAGDPFVRLLVPARSLCR